MSLPSSLNASPACLAPVLASRSMVFAVRLNTLSLPSGCSWSAEYAALAKRHPVARHAMKTLIINGPLDQYERSAIQQELYAPRTGSDGTRVLTWCAD